ncbi:hypothetical protein [Bosea minatitlanensis]|uniref:Uncharacterized protein n=1 Tax=Bosea minatitlanensis TaxID=128782 RepID=A0ABW0EZN9_9HYPH|nr:hypothetical protein [Bosea minatitlanensis]MCT4491695.1 hypothetical protein [Bosea minatitlanensis]
MPPTRRFRFEVVTERPDGRRQLISRHHARRRADRRLIRLPLLPGQSVEILDNGMLVRYSRCPGPNDLPEIPF